MIHTRKLICKDDKAPQPKKKQSREYDRGKELFVKEILVSHHE